MAREFRWRLNRVNDSRSGSLRLTVITFARQGLPTITGSTVASSSQDHIGELRQVIYGTARPLRNGILNRSNIGSGSFVTESTCKEAQGVREALASNAVFASFASDRQQPQCQPRALVA